MLKKGDIVDLVAPASALTEDEYNSCLKFIEKLGLKPRYREFSSLIDKGLGFVSNSANYRFEHLIEAFNNNESKAVWCLSGGYGSYQLLEELAKIKVPANKKIFIGYSDITILLNYFADKWNMPVLHGYNLKEIATGNSVANDAKKLLSGALMGNIKNTEIKLEAVNKVAKEEKELKGKIIGGCLSLLQSLIGTDAQIDYKNKILLIEDDKNESPARLSRIIDHLLRSGCFGELRAVIIGGFLEKENYKDDSNLSIVIDDLSKILDTRKVALFYSGRLGHGNNMIPTALGVETSINSGYNPVMKTEFKFNF